MADPVRTRLALVGSGFIADVHLQVLAFCPSVQVTALVDPVRQRAERLAARHGIARVHASVDDLLQQGGIDAVHVLVPPALHHAVARQCLQAGLHVLVEKPMCLQPEQAVELAALAQERRLVLAVNHNQTCHPAMLRLQRHLQAGRLGRLQHVALVHNVPLRQLQTGDTGHFMFQTEANILFEQGVHLFSMVHALLGAATSVRAHCGEARELAAGGGFFTAWDVALQCERGSASVQIRFGRSMPEMTLHALGSDGTAFVDLQRGSCELRDKTRWLDVLDRAANLWRPSWHLRWRALGTLWGYAASLFGGARPEDPFLRGMAASIADFHAAVRSGGAPRNPASAAQAVLQMCLDTAAAAGAATTPLPRPELPEPGPPRPGEVVVLGGGGLLGRHCVQLLQQQGRPVTLLLRRPKLLPPALRDGARIFQGDAADAATLQRAFAGASTVLHLATVAGDDAAAVETAMAAAVRTAGEVALAAGVQRLVYTSSTAALYLGGHAPVRGSAGPDPQPAARSAYARGKIAAEQALVSLRQHGLDVVIVRPAIVLAPGQGFEHSGIGLWVRDNHCVGWGRGTTPLPLLLAADAATALVNALSAPAAQNHAYNLAGDYRPTARELLGELRRRSGRALHFHGAPLAWLYLQELGKHLIKFLARRPRQLPQLRDLRSRSFRAPLDCSDSKLDLGFAPADRERFLAQLFET